MSEPIAFLLTWVTYGTWLHGDERGSVDKSHNIPGTPQLDPCPPRRAWVRHRLQHAPVTLKTVHRGTVSDTIEAHCRLRVWELFALAVRTSHVHAVVGNVGVPPERIMVEFKAWATRRLREAGHFRGTRVWAHHGSTRYLWDMEAVSAASAYVVEGQDVGGSKS